MFQLRGATLHATSLPALSAQLCGMDPVTSPGHSHLSMVHFRRHDLQTTIEWIDYEMDGPAVRGNDALMAYDLSQVRKGIWRFRGPGEARGTEVRVKLGPNGTYDLEIDADGVTEMPNEFMGLAYQLINNGQIQITSDRESLIKGFQAVVHMKPPELLIKVNDLAGA